MKLQLEVSSQRDLMKLVNDLRRMDGIFSITRED